LQVPVGTFAAKEFQKVWEKREGGGAGTSMYSYSRNQHPLQFVGKNMIVKTETWIGQKGGKCLKKTKKVGDPLLSPGTTR